MAFSRRQWLLTLSASAFAAPAGRTLGVQLDSLRATLKTDPDAALKAIAEMGCRAVEGFGRRETIALLPKLRQYGLTVTSCGTETPLITADWELYPQFKPISLDEAIESLKVAGVEYFAMGYISPGARGDGDDFFRRTADRMNAAGELCRQAGLKFAWRNHAFEFQGRPGLRPIDILRERLDPKLVSLEMDPFWVSVAGSDPVQMLKDWKGSVGLLHLQDKAKGTPVQFSEDIGLGAFAAPGGGSLDFRLILKAAANAGVKHYFTGQDQVDGDPIESLRKNFAYFAGAMAAR